MSSVCLLVQLFSVGHAVTGFLHTRGHEVSVSNYCIWGKKSADLKKKLSKKIPREACLRQKKKKRKNHVGGYAHTEAPKTGLGRRSEVQRLESPVPEEKESVPLDRSPEHMSCDVGYGCRSPSRGQGRRR